ncbi:MAG TPA: nitrilase-related carbon-nitrogen hydrolase [Thermoanaerobaculia bacterium]|nr:nitrilase-related carbon-nitrogen hydrolase [Thermoanaerobaculia bacterium]HUM29847.1 nitrilase-related carbon-nitrogen hydrolase [Thermoanaerobaculia bacterium]HXK68122.1 nitrilase-related carbon-nitrogen hydrolase [Thermoanaerobaculia bacterium]
MYPVACIQFQPAWKDLQVNLEAILQWTDRAGEVRAVFFPELATTGYLFQSREEALLLSLTPDDPRLDPLRRTAERSGKMITFGTPIREGDHLYNSALILHPDGSVRSYHKVHLFDREKNVFDPGPDAPGLIELDDLKVGVLICFDWAFPEIWRSLAMQGADLVVCPSNLVLPGKGQKGVIGHALYNRIYVVLPNRYGVEDDLRFTGGSLIVGPDGEILCEAPGVGDRILRSWIDPALARNKQVTSRNHLFKDRRPGFY